MSNSTHSFLALLGLGLLGGSGHAAAQVLTNNSGTLFVNTDGVLYVNGAAQQTGAALPPSKV